MKTLTVFLVVIVFAALAVAQDAPRVEVFGGYQYLSLDTKGGDRQNLNGWNADAAFHLTPNVSVVADVSGGYKSEGISLPGIGSFSANLRLHNFLFGPRFSFNGERVTPFAEALFGVGHASVGADISGIGGGSVSSNGFAMALGGGLDINANKHFAIRAAKFDYLLNHVSLNEFGFSQSENLNNFRVATGVVFKF